jgi:gamma-glutamylcyclotransferase (GGCT)/AIG2-like uncharacterized protein YtfP
MKHAAGSMITDFFVYGTLKRGECRESMWPRKPLRIREGFVLARLYDLGDYPAIRVDTFEGDEPLDWVNGEVWSFDRSNFTTTLAALDEIEVTNQRGYRNLYDQVLVRVHDQPGSRSSRLALAYQYSSPGRLIHSRCLRPREDASFVFWSAGPEER